MKRFIPRAILLISIVISFQYSKGQSWAPKGATWTFGVGYAMSPDQGYNVWTSTGDSLVAGHICKIIRGRYNVAGDLINPLITYEDSNKIFLYDTLSHQFTVLYDFNKNAGETWTYRIDTCDLIITVDSTGMDTINGYPLKVLYISTERHVFSWMLNGKTLEHIGYTGCPQPDMISYCYNWAVDMDYYTGLRCYQDSAFGFHDFGIAPSCDYTGISTIGNPEFRISPNPATGLCTLQLPATGGTFSAAVFDITCSEVLPLFGKQQISTFSFGTSSLAAGVYFIKVTNSTGKVSVAKLVKE